MRNAQKTVLTLLRILLGWFFLYAGITKVLAPSWSAASYLEGAQTFPAFYEALLHPAILPFVNVANAWGLTAIGVALLLGLFVRLAAPAGALLMLLYYFPVLSFPYAGEHAVLVDEHIVYAAVLLLLAVTNAGTHLGLDRLIARKRSRGRAR